MYVQVKNKLINAAGSACSAFEVFDLDRSVTSTRWRVRRDDDVDVGFGAAADLQPRRSIVRLNEHH